MNPFDVITTPLDPGTCALIEANAGTGKTFNIQHLYLRLILEQKLEPAQILVVTFTEAATAELRDRIRQNLASALALLETASLADDVLSGIVAQARNHSNSDGELLTRLRLALAAFDEAAIFTIHGFCKRTLDRNAFDSLVSFDCELIPSYTDMLRELVTDFYRKERISPDAPVLSLKALSDHANTVTRQIGEIEFKPDQIDEQSLWQNLINTINSTPIPTRAGKFSRAFHALKNELDALTPTSVILENKDLLQTTAKANLPFKDALNQWLEARIINTYARLRAFINHPEYGFEARKSRSRSMGFDDLLRNMLNALPDADCPLACELRKSYAVALVDEFQDTDPVQYHIFETVFKHPNSMFFMIGDPKQAIYGFRGGDIYAYLAAREAVAESSRFTLSHNYRSSEPLIEAVNHLFAPAGAFAESGLDYHNSKFKRNPQQRLLKNGSPDDQPFEILWFSGDDAGEAVSKTHLSERINRECAARIAQMLMGGANQHCTPQFAFTDQMEQRTAVTPGDIAVLVTKHPEAQSLQQRLRQYNIPAVIYKSGNVFHSDEAADLWHVLAAMIAANRPDKIRAALLTPLCGFTAAEILALNEDSEAFEREIMAFVKLHQLWREKGVMVALTAFHAHYHSFETIARKPTCERKLTNLRHLAELLHQSESSSELEPEVLLNWFKEHITAGDIEDEAHEQRMESDRRAVTIMTIHKSKGLQFPVVFVPYLITRDVERWLSRDWTVHSDAEDGARRMVFPIGKSAKEAWKGRRMEENLAEDLRLLYVAVTRAENRCVILMGNVKGKGAKSALNYLGQLHAGNALSPRALIESKLEAGPAAPFNSEAIAITPISLDEIGAHELHTEYTARDGGALLESPHAPPRPVDNWAVMSYSGMTEHAYVAPAHMKPDAGSDEVVVAESPVATEDPLPGGINTGLCVHAIFEKIEFTKIKPAWVPDEGEQTLINTQARYFGLYTSDSSFAEERRARLQTLITTTLNRTLEAGDCSVTLCNVASTDIRREWEFYFNVPRKINTEPFQAVGLTFKAGSNQRHGFMTGSIDLLFRHNGRYFFADWKTDTLNDYAPTALAEAMIARNYQFQAIVYAVALHNHLKQSLGDDYDFHRHFGGGFYLFVRGITAENGVHSYQPTIAEIELWDQQLRNA